MTGAGVPRRRGKLPKRRWALSLMSIGAVLTLVSACGSPPPAPTPLQAQSVPIQMNPPRAMWVLDGAGGEGSPTVFVAGDSLLAGSAWWPENGGGVPPADLAASLGSSLSKRVYVEGAAGTTFRHWNTPGGLTWSTLENPTVNIPAGNLIDTLSFLKPGTTVLALGTNDAIAMTGPGYDEAAMRAEINTSVTTAHLWSKCVFLVKPTDHIGNALTSKAANIKKVGDAMDSVAGEHANTFVLDWNAKYHQLDGPVDPLGWFLQPAPYLPDEVNPHLTLAGQLQYKNFITWEVSSWSFAAGCAS